MAQMRRGAREREKSARVPTECGRMKRVLAAGHDTANDSDLSASPFQKRFGEANHRSATDSCAAIAMHRDASR